MTRYWRLFSAVAVLWALAAAPALAEEYGPWRPRSCVNLQAFGAIHWLDQSDVNNYIEAGEVEEFGNNDYDGYMQRMSPVTGARLGMVFNRFIADLQAQYYKQWRDGDDTGATLATFNLMFHAGVDLVRTRVQVYPFVGIGWSYTNFVVNGDLRRNPQYPDFAGAKEGVPGDVGLGFEIQNPIWTSRDTNYRTAVNIPVFLHLGYQGEIITYFWQIKHGQLERNVIDRFMGPYVRMGIGFGKGKYIR
ncbi:MAG: outer membrane beta-barrel protein [Deltaproteobacteria bacterium]|nr:outer membrane beta-barrel protein [Deltaproteobacteria bacterium]